MGKNKMTLKQFLSLYTIHAKMDLAWLLRDTSFALFAITSDVISNLSSIAGVFLLAWKFNGLGGMNKYEVLFMLAYSNIVFGVCQMFGGGNNLHISRIIGRGQLEHMFIQPVSISAQMITCGFFPFTCCSNLLSGITVMWIATVNLHLTLPWWWILSLSLNVVISVILVVALSYLSASLTFYAPVQCEEISSYVIDSVSYISTFPLSGMPLSLQLPLLTIFPAGLLAWFPTLTLLGKSALGLPSIFPILCVIVLSCIATYFFKRGFNYYVKKGINRYSSMGHRS